MPYQMYSIIVRNSKKTSPDDAQFDTAELDFELYEGQQTETFIDMVTQCVEHRTAVNYHDALWSKVIPETKELEAAGKYALGFNVRQNPNKWCWLIKKEGEYIGFVMCETEGDVFEGIFYGIIPKHRGSRRYAKLIMGFLKKMCAQNGWKYFENDVVFQNMASLKSIVKESVAPVGTYLNINIKCFFVA